MTEAVEKTDESIPEIFKKYELPSNTSGIDGYKFTINGCTLEIDKKMKATLDHCIKAVANKHDAVLLFTGYEGMGKTSHALICAAYILYKTRRTLTDDVFKFLPDEVDKAVKESPVGSVHIWDEAVLGLDSTDTMTKMQKTMRKLFTVCRSRRQFIFLVIPNIWMLNKYFATVRTRYLIHHTSPDGIERGHFRVYGRKHKRVLYIYGKKTYSYSGRAGLYPFASKGRFIDPFNEAVVGGKVISQENYEKRKQKALESINKDDDKEEKKKQKSQREQNLEKKMRLLIEKHKDSHSNLAEIWGVTKSTAGDLVRSLQTTDEGSKA